MNQRQMITAVRLADYELVSAAVAQSQGKRREKKRGQRDEDRERDLKHFVGVDPAHSFPDKCTE